MIDLTPHTADERALHDLLGTLADAWNRGDADAYAANFTEESDYIAFDGTRLIGRKANAESHRVLFDTVLKGSCLVYSNVSMRFLASDIAIVHGEGSVLLPWQQSVAKNRRSIQTYVAAKRDGRWLFTAFHNTRIRPVHLPTGWKLRLLLAVFRFKARGSLTATRERAISVRAQT